MTSRTARKDHLFYLLTLVFIISGAAFWMSDLSSDPPTYFSGGGQSLATDPAQYTYHARNKVLYDDWDPFDYPRWTVYQHSLISLVSYVWFSQVGVSVPKGNMAGLMLSLGGLVLMLLGLARHHRPWVTTAFAFCYVINVTLLTYGRLSYLENGLIFLASLFFVVYSWWGNRVWGVVLAGLLTALATFTGKLFGALLLPAMLLAILCSDEKRKWLLAVAGAVAFVASSLILVLILYGDNMAAAFGYVGEQSYGLRGFPDGLSSPWGFVEHLISYGYRNRLYYLNPDLFLFLAVGAGMMVLLRGNRLGIDRHSRATVLTLFWAVIGIVGLMPLNYSPLRYSLLFIPAIIIFASTTIDHCLRPGSTPLRPPGRLATGILFVLVWAGLFQVIANLFLFNISGPPVSALTWGTLPPAVAVTWFGRRMIAARKLTVSHRSIIAILVAMLCFSALTNACRIRRAHLLDHNFNMSEANKDLLQILGPGAVVSGPYGPALTVNGDIKSFIHLFGVARVDSTLFDRYPITHLAVDVSNCREAIMAYPQIGPLRPITTYRIRDMDVKLFNISKVFGNPEAQTYQESHYEKAVGHFHAGDLDSAEIEISRHLKLRTMSKSSGLLIGDLPWNRKEYDDVVGHMTWMADRYPTDYFVQLQCGRFLQVIGMMRKDGNLVAMSQTYYDRAVRVNRFKEEYIMEIQNETRQKMRNAVGPP